MVSCWGGYSFIINIIPLFVLLILFFNRYNHSIYIAYSIFYTFSTVFAMQIPFVRFLAISSSDHLLSHGVFIILQIIFILKIKPQLIILFKSKLPIILALSFGVIFVSMQVLGLTRWTGRTLTLLDPTYAKKYIPIVASVA